LIYRKERPDLHEASTFKMPCGVPLCIFSLVFFACMIVLLTLEPDTLLALSLMPVWFAWLALVYFLKYKGVNEDNRHVGGESYS